MDMNKSDAVLDEIIKGIRGFLDGRQIVANTVSEKDMDSVGNIYNLNQISPANIGAKAQNMAVGGENRPENSLGSGDMAIDISNRPEGQ